VSEAAKTFGKSQDGTLWDFPSVVMQEALSRTLLELRTLVPGSLAEALTVTDLQQTRDEVARTLRGNTAGQVEALCHLLRQRQGYRLRGWLEAVEQHGEPELQALARHLHTEESAV